MGSTVSKKRRESLLSDSEARSKLQKKICLAEETPEPVYDISTCVLRTVPAGTYAKCKVLRKQQLLMQDNLLTSLEAGGQMADLHLLQVLRLDFNCLAHLTDDISALASLQVLDLSNNTLKELPPAVGELRQLRQLLCRGNGLRQLPAAVGRLPRLAVLDVRNNQLMRLPALPNVGRLSELKVGDNESLSAPPPDVVRAGSDAVIAFLCKEAGIEHTGPSDNDVIGDMALKSSELYSDDIDAMEEKIHRYDQLKENKRLDLLELERRLSASTSQQKLEVSRQEELKRQLLDELAEDQARLDADVARAAGQRDRDHRRLLDSLWALEQQADRSAAQVAAAAARLRDPAGVLTRLQLDRQELQQLVTVHQEECDALRQHEVMQSMEQVLLESCAVESQRQLYQRDRDLAVQQALTQDQRADAELRQLLQLKDSEQEARIQQLLRDEVFQRQAFYNLYLQQDANRLQILHQISEAEEALLQLTVVEANQRDASKESEMVRLSEKRIYLASVLVQLMEQQEAREHEIRRRLQEMDEQRRGEVQHYWLVQYQRLLDSKPERIRGLEADMDEQVRKLIESAGGDDYLTLFATKGVSYKTLLYMNDADLNQLGVTDLSTRDAILRQTAFVRDDDDYEKATFLPASPSAPPAADSLVQPQGVSAGATAGGTATYMTTHTELECVVCMDRKTAVIFLNCGHLCVCRDCSGPLRQCPMCRQTVVQKLVITSALDEARP